MSAREAMGLGTSCSLTEYALLRDPQNAVLPLSCGLRHHLMIHLFKNAHLHLTLAFPILGHPLLNVTPSHLLTIES